MDLLHIAARIAIRVWPPVTAKRRIDAVGSLLRPVDVEEASRIADRLVGGTCLSRAITIAARMPGAEVVVGAKPVPWAPFSAHAWVERGGSCIGRSEGKVELARFK
jgi:hypothetical protein